MESNQPAPEFSKDVIEEKRGKSWRRDREDRGRKTSSVSSKRSDVLQSANTCESHVLDDRLALPKDATGNETECTGVDEKEVMETPSAQIYDNNSSTKTHEDDCEEVIEEGSAEDHEDIEETERKYLESKIEEMKEKFTFKEQLRNSNKNAAGSRPEEAFFSRLDSSLRKNTAFVKKMRNITEMQRDSLIKDMNCLNLTRYIGEVADAIVEAKLKMSDINAAVQICSLLHQRYADFSPMLLEKWQRILTFKKDEKISNPSKLRVDLRFYAELVSSGVFTLKEGLPLLGNLLTTLINMDKEEHNNLPIILVFCKYCGEDFCGLVVKKVQLLAEKYGRDIPKSNLLNPERQKAVRTLLKDYYHSLCKHLQKSHQEIQLIRRHNRRILQTKGELNADRREKCDNAEVAHQKLLSSAQQFAETLDEELPVLPEDEALVGDNEKSNNIDVHNRFKNNEFQFDNESSLWEDEDTRSFYENLPDLKAFIPAILFKDSAPLSPPSDIVEKQIDEELEYGPESYLDANLQEENVANIDCEERSTISVSDVEITAVEIEDVEDEPEVSGSAAGRVLLDAFLTSLPHCVSRELIDKAAIEFCLNLNTKPNRKKLVRALFLVPRTRLDLLPFYSRLVATLNPCMSDVATDLSTMLKQDFKHHISKKDQINIESKVKTVRFIGELVKFKMYLKSEALFCLKMLLLDFSHHHIEMTCNLLETCGRYLFRSQESHYRTQFYLEQMMRKKSVMALDSRYITMIENAFYYCNPPEVQQSVKRERPPMFEYIRKLLYKDLGKNNTEKVLRQLRKLSWDDPEITSYASKCLTAIWNVKYYNIRCVANLLAGLVVHREHIGPQVVDGVLEDIRLGMEINNPKYNQRRVSAVRYLGELYNYRMVESTVIFKVIYSFITFGVSYEGVYSELDPHDNLFRIRLICILLDTCGQYFNSGSSKKKLDCFITYFQRYYWMKHSSDVWTDDNRFPVTVEYMVKDTVTTLRPKLKLITSFEDAQTAVELLEEELRSKLGEVLPSYKDIKNDGTVDGLETVPETDEEEGGDDDDHSTAASDADVDGEQDDELEMVADSQSQPFDAEDIENEDDGQDTGNSQPPVTDDEQFFPGGPKHISCPEDEDFMTAFDKMMAENIQHRSQESLKIPQVDIPVPVNVKSSLKKNEVPLEDKTTINFILMTRKGNKQQYKNLEVSVNSELALNLKDREQAEKVEKERVKRLTLDINERQEEEDYQEMLAAQQRPMVMNLNRERRQKYQHPKGAPDADLIFGNK